MRLRNILLRLRADELTAVAGAENSVAEEQVNRATLFEVEPVEDFASDDLELAEIEACLARLRNGTRNPKSVESSDASRQPKAPQNPLGEQQEPKSSDGAHAVNSLR